MAKYQVILLVLAAMFLSGVALTEAAGYVVNDTLTASNATMWSSIVGGTFSASGYTIAAGATDYLGSAAAYPANFSCAIEVYIDGSPTGNGRNGFEDRKSVV